MISSLTWKINSIYSLLLFKSKQPQFNRLRKPLPNNSNLTLLQHARDRSSAANASAFSSPVLLR
jgi:hypothetical protein